MNLHLSSLLFAASIIFSGPLYAQTGEITVAAVSTMANWNAVAPLSNNTLFAAAPRWTGSKGPQLTYIDEQGKQHAWPDKLWNSWSPGESVENRFVNINAIRLIGPELWVVDTGAPDFGGTPLPGGAKLVVIDVNTQKVIKTYIFNSSIAGKNSYIDDLRINGKNAYLTDAGWAGLIVLNLETGESRRVLSNSTSTRASNKAIRVGGNVVLAPDGSMLKVNADPLELSPDRQWLYYGPLNGPLYRIPTYALDDKNLDNAALEKLVQRWFDMPPSGGTAMAKDGTLYYSDLAENALKRRLPDGRTETVIKDPNLHWVDAPVIDENNVIWLPVPQIDRVSLFNNGENLTKWPVQILKIDLEK
ncbi:L-dopachrome tautomerase-related protein [Enterobacter roggenkampii]|uniref:L-dopachrome tautomerase-related protein n=1 Tax=Enterobacter roggenkampii TaxID=1812935 RepID=UPI002DBD6DF8|nr:L-dopachrome tautomerase-related protein [Enterobacter roggenkampii]MEB5887491.1 major royal jelly family protein [Enterobacter roggenkampii]